MADPAAATLNEAVSQLRGAARFHKRAAGKHQRQARELMQQVAALEAKCRELGIELDAPELGSMSRLGAA